MATSCNEGFAEIKVYETSESGNKLTQVYEFKTLETPSTITLAVSYTHLTLPTNREV